MRPIRNKFILIAFVSFLFLLPSSSVFAYSIETLSGAPATGNYVLSQSKTEVRLNPGEQATRPITVTNLFGSDVTFTVSVEDFIGSTSSPDQEVDFLGAAKSPYSLKDYLKPEVTTFTLQHGQRITFPVLIPIPLDARPGDLYGAVIVSAAGTAGAPGPTQVKVISRLASLFFVRVNGEVKESGGLVDFTSDGKLYLSGPVGLDFIFKNTGNVYLNPYGRLKVYDTIGREVYSKNILPYFVLPGAVREQKEMFNRPGLVGFYKATLTLNRGYGNYLDQKSLYFLVLPVYSLVLGLVVIILIIWLIWRVKISYEKK